MPAMSGPSMTSIGRAAASRASSVSSTMNASMPSTSAWVSRSSTGSSRQASASAPAASLLRADLVRDREQPLRRVRPAVQDDVLDELAQLRLDVVVDRELAGVDDAHVHARGDRVVQEHRVDRLADRVVAAEAERDVRHAARDAGAGQLGLDPPGRLDERHGVAGVLLDAGRDREDVRVEDDVLGREPGLLGQQVVGAVGDRDLALDRVGLALLVERHDDDRGAVAAAQPGVLEERRPRPPSSRSS